MYSVKVEVRHRSGGSLAEVMAEEQASKATVPRTGPEARQARSVSPRGEGRSLVVEWSTSSSSGGEASSPGPPSPGLRGKPASRLAPNAQPWVPQRFQAPPARPPPPPPPLPSTSQQPDAAQARREGAAAAGAAGEASRRTDVVPTERPGTSRGDEAGAARSLTPPVPPSESRGARGSFNRGRTASMDLRHPPLPGPPSRDWPLSPRSRAGVADGSSAPSTPHPRSRAGAEGSHTATASGAGTPPPHSHPPPPPPMPLRRWAPRTLAGADSMEIVSGNPAVERIFGVVHLFRDSTSRDDAASTRPARALPEGRGTEVACLSVPSDMALSEFCRFLGAFLHHVRSLRVVQRHPACEPSVYLALLAFEDQESADDFFRECNGRPFSSLEPEVVCRLGFIRGVEFSDGTASLCPAASTQGPTVGAPAQTELPSCPVCLERLDEHVSGVVVTVCNHAFHNECLLKWGDTSCPVCRFCLQPTGTARCATCGASDSLWMCLICGAVGCGRYSGGHARAHWEAHGHSYALELDTQRVWDYVGDGWVHRLVQSKAAGAAGETFIVEVSSGGGAAGEFVGSLGPGGDEVGGADAKARRETEEEGKPGGRKPSKSGMKVEGGAGMEAEWAHRSEEDVVLESRMEAVTREYEHLLTSQLESQRLWFEGQMERQAEDLLRRQRILEDKLDEALSAEQETARGRGALQAKVQELEGKLAKERATVGELRKERDFLKNLADTVLADQGAWRARVEEMTAEVRKRDAELADLKEQVRDLALFLDAQNAIKSDPEMAGGDVEVGAAPARQGRGRGRGRR